jgi:hypothetical protein
LYEVRRRGDKGLALDNNCNVGYPHSNCEPHNELVFVPDGKSGAHNGRFGWEEDWPGKMERTYIRKTIKTEAAARPTYEKT